MDERTDREKDLSSCPSVAATQARLTNHEPENGVKYTKLSTGKRLPRGYLGIAACARNCSSYPIQQRPSGRAGRGPRALHCLALRVQRLVIYMCAVQWNLNHTINCGGMAFI